MKMRGTDSIYNSKELILDEDLTFLSFNQTVNLEFRLEDLLESPLWFSESMDGLVKCVPLFNCDRITSSNVSDRVLDGNRCVICEDIDDTLITCSSSDTGGVHYYSVELYGFCPYPVLDLADEVTVYCVLHDEYLNSVGNVAVDVLVDDELVGSVVSDDSGVCRFKVEEPCTVQFLYGESVSDEIVIGGE